MTKSAWGMVLGIALGVAPAAPSEARGHFGRHPGFEHHEFRGRGAIVIGPSFWWGPPFYPLPYYPPPPVVVQEPPVYIQQQPAPPSSYWYYCPSAQAYYPSVQACPEPWITVAPRP
jgi:hypothetical protein